MRRMSDALRRAFAIDPPGPVEPTAEQSPVVDRLCREIVRRHLTTPALLFLEMSRPLNYVGAQAMHFFAPIATVIFDQASYRHFSEFLEHRGSIEYLCRRIEKLEQEAMTREAKPAPRNSGRDEASGADR